MILETQKSEKNGCFKFPLNNKQVIKSTSSVNIISDDLTSLNLNNIINDALNYCQVLADSLDKMMMDDVCTVQFLIFQLKKMFLKMN